MFSARASRFAASSRQPLIPATVFSLSLSLAATAHAATYYVATTGSDSNPGTQAAPFRTIAKGSQAMAGGDTLFIRGGTYNEAMMNGVDGFVFRNGASMSAMTRYAAYNGEKPVIMPSKKVAGTLGFSHTSQYIEINGLVIDGTNATAANVLLHDGTAGTNGENLAKNILLLNNEIRNGRQGIAGGGQCQIISNNIHGMTGYGIYTGGQNGLLERNIFHDNGGYAMHVYQSHMIVGGWVIRNNTIYNNGNGYYFGDAAGGAQFRKVQAVLISRGSNNQFYNNLVYNNDGVFIGYGASDTLVANNTIFGNGITGINVSGEHSGSSGAKIYNNIVWGNRSSQITDTGTGTQLQNNLTIDPHVQNAAGGDFHLTSASTDAIDKGMAVTSVPNDFDYGARPFAAAYDIGAFEFGAPPGTTPSPPIPVSTGGSTPPGGGGGGSGMGGLSNCAR